MYYAVTLYQHDVGSTLGRDSNLRLYQKRRVCGKKWCVESRKVAVYQGLLHCI